MQYIADTDAPGDVLQLLVMFGDVEYRHWLPAEDANEGLLLVASDFGIDAEAVKAKTRANLRAAAQAQAQPAQAAGPDTASTPRPAAQASAQIADALAALEGGQIQAPAAQGDEAPPVPSGQAAASVAPHRQGGADASDGAAATAARPALGIDVQVRILPTATGKKQAPHVGKVGKILRRIGAEAWDVAIPREKRGVPMFVAFHDTELEALE